MKLLNELLFGARFLIYGMLFGTLMSLLGITGLWGFAVLCVALPLIFMADNKFIKHLKRL